MSEYKFILFLVIAVIFLLIHLFIVKLNSSEQIEQYDGFGMITRINMNERGRTWYYVDININGKIYSAQTDPYQTVLDDVKKGDLVSVKYRFTKKGLVRCYITQDGFKRVIQEGRNRKPVMLYAAGVCFLIFLFMLIKTLLKI